MSAGVTAVAAVSGLVVGSCLNVLIARLCPGAAPSVGARLRHALVALVTAAVFALLALRFGAEPALLAFGYLGAVGVALAVIDLQSGRLPDALTLPSYLVAGVLLGVAALADGDPAGWLRALAGGAALYGLYLLLAVLRPAGMGFGDVKLAGVLGMYLGYLGWGVLLVGAFLGFVLGALAGAGLMLTHRATRRSALPFGPFMVSGALVAVLFGHSLADAYVNAVV